MWPDPQFPADLVTFSGEILNGKLHFLCSGVAEKLRAKIRWKGSKYVSAKQNTIVSLHKKIKFPIL